MKIIYSNFLPAKGFKAMNLFGVIVVRKDQSGLDERLHTHESVHTRQMVELLVIGFYIWYVVEWLFRWIRAKDRYTAYKNICFEREAYENDSNRLYLKQRKRYAFTKYLLFLTTLVLSTTCVQGHQKEPAIQQQTVNYKNDRTKRALKPFVFKKTEQKTDTGAHPTPPSKTNNIKNMDYNRLTPEEERVIIHKGTERPFTGEYLDNKVAGSYFCKRCDAPLYRSQDKFDAHCGWPSFDDEIEGAVKRVRDADGRRTEIICNNCGAHLGHVFMNEGFTPKQTRHCVNSISLKFVPEKQERFTTAYFASGCFWGTEYYFMKAPGVKQTAVGFMGGDVENPTYEQVCQKNTGHLETTEVVFDPAVTSYEAMVKLFFETHDFTQTDGQGPDIGPQYLSCIFYSNPAEKMIAEKYIDILTEKGYKVATMLKPASVFWKAENYHQQYYEDKGGKPYCHKYTAIF